jgi:hypothetical protein
MDVPPHPQRLTKLDPLESGSDYGRAADVSFSPGME